MGTRSPKDFRPFKEGKKKSSFLSEKERDFGEGRALLEKEEGAITLRARQKKERLKSLKGNYSREKITLSSLGSEETQQRGRKEGRLLVGRRRDSA